MHRVQTFAAQVLCPRACAAEALVSSTSEGISSNAPRRTRSSSLEKAEKVKRFIQVGQEFVESVENLKKDGTPPKYTAFEVQGLNLNFQTREIQSERQLGEALKHAESMGSLALAESNALPGPWREATTWKAKMEVLMKAEKANVQGWNVNLFAEWQCKYGDHGLSSNIVVPGFVQQGSGLETKAQLTSRVILADPSDAERIARIHTKKDGSFEGLLLDSVISTTDNEHWQRQRRELTEVFLPLSSLAKILPTSRDRAKACCHRLSEPSATAAVVDMSDFLLHEAQAQLQLALLGLPESFMESTNQDIRRAFMIHPDAEPGKLSEAMRAIMQKGVEDHTFTLPTDVSAGEKGVVCGPLMRAVQKSELGPTANYGNLLLILFAGHDTTGHAMTWLLFELARHPVFQRKLQLEVDAFFESLDGRDPEYEDLGRLGFLDRCITETLRLWNSVPNGTFRQLQFDDTVMGNGGKLVKLPRGTFVQIVTWSRHRNPILWGPDADEFNPERNFQPCEIMRVGGPMGATNPQSHRFSPFVHTPRNCLGRNFAQMEMRLIIPYLLHEYEFALAPAYEHLLGKALGPTVSDADAFRGVNRGTMGPLDLVNSPEMPWGIRHTVGLPMRVHRRT